ncbi:hypothetical protein BDV95DRAFT_139136 [Massariosphaeria phaeospora]|uniref:Uncharacterized protein n=1 Tax=Massariosphaeria phaeospora TaxID=100035 RepID=A0A7C8IDT3_9PLEO|nr:hypothetical protein BDV95DRAFT_139136 [Massariosphaeria phaeospora]
MQLLDIPPELFARTIHLLVDEVGIRQSCKYRHVCRLFASEILNNIIACQPVEELLRSDRTEALFLRHGGAILRSRVLQTHRHASNMAVFTRRLIDAIVSLEGSGLASLRQQYTADICNALACVRNYRLYAHVWQPEIPMEQVAQDRLISEGLPAAAAAIGNIELFTKLQPAGVTLSILTWNHVFLPNALFAAVGSGKSSMVRFLLDHVSRIIRKDSKTGKWLSLDELAECLENDILVAIRSHHNDLGVMMFDFLLEQKKKVDAHIGSLVDGVVRECIRFGNPEFCCTVLKYRGSKVSRSSPVITSSSSSDSKEAVKERKEVKTWPGGQYLFRYGDGSVLRALIQQGFIDPNHSHVSTPLDLTLYSRRYNLAHISAPERRGSRRQSWGALCTLGCCERRAFI